MYICSLWSNLYSMYNLIKEDFHILDMIDLLFHVLNKKL